MNCSDKNRITLYLRVFIVSAKELYSDKKSNNWFNKVQFDSRGTTCLAILYLTA